MIKDENVSYCGGGVRVISKSRLRQFWEARRGDRNFAERDLQVWYKSAKNATWTNFGDLRRTFASADAVGRCIVFDVGNNRFRLIARVFYGGGRVYVLKIMDHVEYDANRWPDECECYDPAPRKARRRPNIRDRGDR